MSEKRVAVFLHSGDYDRIHQGAAIAAAAAAGARPVEVFFFWWALRRLVDGGLGTPELPGEPDLAHRFETRGYPTAEALLTAARATGVCRVFACSASMEMLGLRPPQLEPLVDSILGWSGILDRTQGISDRFYL
jgi:peroxiredoxin family protein